MKIVIYDDLDATERDTRTEAETSVVVGLNGQWAELDLTAAHAAEVETTLRHYLAAGHRPHRDPASLRYAAGRNRPQTIVYNRGMRAFADANGYHYPKRVNGSPAGNYPKELREAYAKHLAAGGKPSGK